MLATALVSTNAYSAGEDFDARLKALEAEIQSLKEQSAGAGAASFLDKIKLNGYVNMVLSQSDEEVPYWSGEDDKLSINDHSSAGVRLTTEMSEKSEVVMQYSLLPSQDGGYDTSVEWFYVQYTLLDQVSVKAGRISLPVLNYSEEFEVGYAHPWIRPPEEVYGPLPLSEIDGISLSYQDFFGDFGVKLKGTWGHNDFSTGGFSVEQNEIYGLDFEFSYSDFALRAAHMNMKFTADAEVPFVVAESTGLPITPGVEGDPIATGSIDTAVVRFVDADYKLTSLGFTYDNSIAFVTGEGSSYSVEDTGIGGAFVDEDGYYLTVGWYIDDLTPYYTYAYTESKNKIERTQRGQYLGLRYSLTAKSNITVELQHFDEFEGSNGLFGGFNSTSAIDFESANVLNIAYQAVF